MAQSKISLLLKIALVLFGVISLFYGLSYMFFPQLHIEASSSEPVPSGWLRWFGPILLALGIGTFMVLRSPVKQGIFVKTLAIGTLLCGLTLIYSATFELEGVGDLAQTLVPGIVLIIISIILWIGLTQSKDILK